MPERAEIEARLDKIEALAGHIGEHWRATGLAIQEEARGIRSALDRVRDARGGNEAARLRAAAKRVLEADMRGVRDLDALNALEDAAGFSQQGQRRARESDEGGNQ
jgi:hypothetical protein